MRKKWKEKRKERMQEEGEKTRKKRKHWV